MKPVYAITILAALGLLAPAGVNAQTAPAAGAPVATKNLYEDPAMHFSAPADYTRLPVPLPADFNPGHLQQPTMVAAFIKNRGKEDQRFIQVTLQEFEGPLDGFEATDENTLRSSTDELFVSKKLRTGLQNGMPAFWLAFSIGSGFTQLHRYQYDWIDGLRGVSVSITARDITEKEAQDALSDATAVAYPMGRV